MSGNTPDNSGILSKNDRRERDSQPEYTSDAVINGTPVWINAWVNERKDGSGRKYFRLTFKAKDQQQAPTRPQRGPDLDDDIPF